MKNRLTVAEVCDLAGITRRSWDLIKAQGRGPVTTKVDGRIMIAATDADAWLKRHEKAAA